MGTKTKNNVETLMNKGTYKSHYLVYIRKSTDEEDNQKNSLLYQRNQTIQYSKSERLPLAPITLEGFATNGVISEKHSAFKDSGQFKVTRNGQFHYEIERPKFARLMWHLEQGHFKGVICLCYDRLSRNKLDSASIDRMRRKGVDFEFVWGSYDASSSGALHMDIDGMFANHHSRVTSEKVRAAQQKLREEGICFTKAPIGYLDVGNSGWKPQDPDRAPRILEAFEKCATGEWSIPALTRWAADVGFTMPARRRRRTLAEILADDEDHGNQNAKVERPILANRMQQILTNRFYAGYMRGNAKGEWILSKSHEPIVSMELFERVQKVLAGRRTSRHYQNVLDLPYRKFVRCDRCDRVYTPYRQKGILYFGARCKPECSNTKRNINTAAIESYLATQLSTLAFTEIELLELEARLSMDISTLHEKQATEISQIERKKRRIREDLKYIDTNRTLLLRTGAFTLERLVAEETRLKVELETLQTTEMISDEALRDTMKEVSAISELLNAAKSLFEKANTPERERIGRVLFSELRVFGNTLQHRVTIGMKPFEARLTSVSGPIEWLSELSICMPEVRLVRTTLQDIINLPRK